VVQRGGPGHRGLDGRGVDSTARHDLAPRLGDAGAGAEASVTTTEFSIVSGGIACIIDVTLLVWRRQTFWNEDV
jgi:hypothetical protein